MKDVASLCIDTSGEGLHKRGYRPAHNAAPLKETMAAAMVSLSRYRGREDFCDPFCGSGTIPIEAALIAKTVLPACTVIFQPCAGEALISPCGSLNARRPYRASLTVTII